MFVIYLGCFLLFLYYFITKNHSYWKSRGVPHEKPFLFFGSFHKITGGEHISQSIRRIYSKYATPYVGYFIFNESYLMVRSPELIKKVLVKDFDKFMNKDIEVDEAADPLSFHNLAVAKDATWRNLRIKLSPVFTSGKMKLMFPLMKKCADDLNLHLSQRVGETVEITNVMKRYSVDVISSCAFGFDSNCLKNEDSEVLQMATDLLGSRSLARNLVLFCILFIPRLARLLKFTFTDPKASSYFISLFKNVRQERNKMKVVRNDLIDLLNNIKKNETSLDKYKFDDLKMSAQAILFFSAGNDTTSYTMTFALYELALNPDIQERLRTEIRETFDKEGTFTYETIQSMKYLDMFLSEILRKYPIAPFLGRQTVSDYTFEDTGLHLEKGTKLHVPVSGLHFDPEYFPDPEKFDPERFNDENKRNIKPYTYIPFGDGPRICLGQRFAQLNFKVGVSHFIKDFAVEPTDTTNIPLKFLPTSIFLESTNGVPLKVTKV